MLFMKKFGINRFIFPAAAAAVAAILAAVFINGATVANRIANGLFVGGIISLVIGIFRLMRQFGFGDSFLYSHLRVSQVIRRHRNLSKKTENNEEIEETKVTSYYDYLQDKTVGKPCAAALTLGAVLLASSFAIALI